MGTANHHRIGGLKLHLIGGNRNNSSRRENDEPDEGNGKTNTGISSSEVGLKKPVHMQISHFSRNFCREYRLLRTRKCGSYTMVHKYSIAVHNHLHVTYPGRWIGRCGPIAWPPSSPNLNPLDFFF
ncbi:hypothetical protein TNCV_1563971 [Trichonephila clavipes]|nr:hypothetical protein TNCV_1563971 [Trichonephila clavipes]